MDLGIGRSLDRISTLPDSMCHILSFLPTKFAVGTGILSTRWRFLWTYVPNLDFDDSLFLDRSKVRNPSLYDEDLSFMDFVDKVLLLNFGLVSAWSRAVINRNARKVEIRYMVDYPTNLPSVFLTSRTLVVLILERGIFLDVPASVWLPSLKILQLLTVEYKHEDSARKLLSGCPVLEELFIETYPFYFQGVIDISVPTLKRLKILRENEYYSEVAPDSGYKLVINAPKLEHLNLEDYLSDNFCVENLPFLLNASLYAGACIYKLLIGVTNVKFLKLSDSTLLHFTTDYALPTFHNLIRLELGTIGDSGWNFLAEFLECSPNLEVLILQKARSFVDSGKCWSPPRRVPNCFLLHLKEIEMKKFNGKKHELEAIEYLLKNAKVLKKMTVDSRSSNRMDSAFKKLTDFPRGSSTCQLDLRF